MRGRMIKLLIVGVLSGTTVVSSAQQLQPWRDPSPHQTQLVTVDENVQLEVLDWGGSGRPIVLLSGLGNTAHIFDEFAPQLVSNGHVYGVTRRGYGASSVPSSGFGAERLGEDVHRVLDTLKIERPVVVGHSIAGQELSYLATRFPGEVSGVVYLEAAYRYAFMPAGPPPPPASPPPPLQPRPASPADLANIDAYRAWSQRFRGYAPPEAEVRQTRAIGADGSVGAARTPASVGQAISAGMQPFTKLPAPLLAVFSVPHDVGPWAKDDPALAAFESFDETMTQQQATALEAAIPGARVVRVHRANHYVFLSNREQVLDEIRRFLATLH